MLTYLSTNERYTVFPNYIVALTIFSTIPVTVASGERSFSRLQLIKNPLRSTIHEDRFNILAIIGIEREVIDVKKQNFNYILYDFATLMVRKEKFIYCFFLYLVKNYSKTKTNIFPIKNSYFSLIILMTTPTWPRAIRFA